MMQTTTEFHATGFHGPGVLQSPMPRPAIGRPPVGKNDDANPIASVAKESVTHTLVPEFFSLLMKLHEMLEEDQNYPSDDPPPATDDIVNVDPVLRLDPAKRFSPA